MLSYPPAEDILTIQQSPAMHVSMDFTPRNPMFGLDEGAPGTTKSDPTQSGMEKLLLLYLVSSIELVISGNAACTGIMGGGTGRPWLS